MTDGDDRSYRPAEAAILDATERLLRERPFSQLSVGDIVADAGVSRTSFYVHFASRTAVIAQCLRRVMSQVAVAVDPLLAEAEIGWAGAESAIRASLRRWVDLSVDHGALLRTVSEEWPHDDELRELWLGMLGAFTAGTARVIERARAGGQAPPGADPEALAACVMWGYERVLHVALVGDALGLPDPEATIEPLAQMMVAGVFGRTA